ncbi:Hypothetical protein PBC10988_33430 [Planctomycetales bacterium 10988]|nr:Hypothetical protein PBC10988_33430 [Planctomycetales bacterium 10988]
MERIQKRMTWLAVVTLVSWGGLGIIGCGDASKTPTPETQSAEKPTESNEAASDSMVMKTPVDAVQKFLTAVKGGDNALADQLLTPVARQKIEEHNLYVAPPGTPTAKFQVGEFEVKDDGAQVYSTWTDVDEYGEEHTDKLVWILRDEDNIGWRIAGVATTVIEGRPPLILNFEDPEEMEYKKQLLAEEIARLQQEEQRQQQATEEADNSGEKETPPRVASQPDDGPNVSK